jgi:hypothetical protein
VFVNLTSALEELIANIVQKTPGFGHIDPSRLVVSLSSTRGGGIGGVYAKIHPLRFPGGGSTGTLQRGHRKVTCEIPPLVVADRDILYLIYFLVPRFFDLPLREKLVTICHELYHVSPAFDGDIRRFPGRNFAHGSSRKKFDEVAAAFADDYLASPENRDAAAFLDETMRELRARYRVIVGRRLRAPRLRIVQPTA